MDQSSISLGGAGSNFQPVSFGKSMVLWLIENPVWFDSLRKQNLILLIYLKLETTYRLSKTYGKLCLVWYMNRGRFKRQWLSIQKHCNCQRYVTKVVANDEFVSWVTYHLLCGNQQIDNYSCHYFCQSCSYILTSWLISIWVTFCSTNLQSWIFRHHVSSWPCVFAVFWGVKNYPKFLKEVKWLVSGL